MELEKVKKKSCRFQALCVAIKVVIGHYPRVLFSTKALCFDLCMCNVYVCVYKSFAKSNVAPRTLIETCFVLPKTIHIHWQQEQSHTSPHSVFHDSHGVRSCDFKLILLTKMIYVY